MNQNLLTETEQIKAPAKKVMTGEDILEELGNSIEALDFLLLAFPESRLTIEKMEELRPRVTNPDGTLNEDNAEDLKEYQKLQKQLAGYKLTRNHYLVLVVDQLLKIAEANDWGLCKKNGFIYVYNGSFWNEISKEAFQYFLGNVALKMGVEKFKAKIFGFKDDLHKQFMSEAYLPTPPEDNNKVLINLQNGTFEIGPDGKQLREFKREDFVTYQLPFDYDPQAKARLFQKYLDEVIPDKGKQNILAEYAGYIFTKTEVLKLEKMLILYGSGANGKSVFFEIINALLGSENVSNYSLQSLTDEKGYHRAKIANKLVNYASEINGKLEVDIFKQMASGEPIDARLPYGEPFIIKDYAKLIFNSNDLPKDVEHTNAFFRRFLIIAFDETIPEHKQDRDLANKIIARELSGVFNWVLAGLDRILKNRSFSKCKAVDNARALYEKASDSVKMFIDDYKYRPAIDDYIPISQLYPEYRNYCLGDGFRAVNKSNFIKRLNHHKIFTKRMTVGNVAMVSRKKTEDDEQF